MNSLWKSCLWGLLIGGALASQGSAAQKSVHRIVVTEIGTMLKTQHNEGTDVAASVKLLGYEYIHPANWGIEIVPLNLALWTGKVEKGPIRVNEFGTTMTFLNDRDGGTAFYMPFWLKYHFRTEGESWWPYIGLGLGVYATGADQFGNEPDQDRSGKAIAGEVGVDFGSPSARHLIALKIYPAGAGAYNATFLGLTYSFRWALGQHD